MVARAHAREQPRGVGVLPVALLGGGVQILFPTPGLACALVADARDADERGVGELGERREPHVAAHRRRRRGPVGFRRGASGPACVLGRAPQVRVPVVVAHDLRQCLSCILRRVERARDGQRPLLQQQRGRLDRRDRRVALPFAVEVRHRERRVLELHQAGRGLRGLWSSPAAAPVPRLVVTGGQPALAGGRGKGLELGPRRRYAVEEPRVAPLPSLGRHAPSPNQWRPRSMRKPANIPFFIKSYSVRTAKQLGIVLFKVNFFPLCKQAHRCRKMSPFFERPRKSHGPSIR